MGLFCRKKSALPLCLALLAALQASSCARKYTIRSEPSDAMVYINGKPVGKTPLEFPAKDMPETSNVKIEVVKENHGELTTFIPGPQNGLMSADLFISIPKSESDVDKVNRNTGLVIRAHQLLLKKRYGDATKLLDEAITENPRYVYPQILKGSILFLTENFQDAVTQFQRVLELEPANADARRMLQYIANKKGIVPAVDPDAGAAAATEITGPSPASVGSGGRR